VPADTSLGRDAQSPKVPAKKGANQFVWNLRTRPASDFEGMILWGGRLAGPVVVPGRYQARLTVGKESQTRAFEVVKDPRLSTTAEDFRAQFEFLAKMRDKLTEVHDGIALIREVRSQMDDVVSRAKRAGKEKAVADSAKAISKRLTAIEETLYQTKSKSNQDPLNYPIRLNNKLAELADNVASADARPTDQTFVVWTDLSGRIDAQLAKLRIALDADLAAFNKLVRDAEVPAVVAKRKGTAK
jgi:hypothetical protein